MVLGKGNQNLRFMVRGFAKTPIPGGATLHFTVGGEDNDLSGKLGGENFTACFDAKAIGTTLDVAWTGSVAQMKGDQSILAIDSIDIASSTSGFKPDASAGCK